MLCLLRRTRSILGTTPSAYLLSSALASWLRFVGVFGVSGGCPEHQSEVSTFWSNSLQLMSSDVKCTYCIWIVTDTLEIESDWVRLSHLESRTNSNRQWHWPALISGEVIWGCFLQCQEDWMTCLLSAFHLGAQGLNKVRSLGSHRVTSLCAFICTSQGGAFNLGW